MREIKNLQTGGVVYIYEDFRGIVSPEEEDEKKGEGKKKI